MSPFSLLRTCLGCSRFKTLHKENIHIDLVSFVKLNQSVVNNRWKLVFSCANQHSPAPPSWTARSGPSRWSSWSRLGTQWGPAVGKCTAACPGAARCCFRPCSRRESGPTKRWSNWRERCRGTDAFLWLLRDKEKKSYCVCNINLEDLGRMQRVHFSGYQPWQTAGLTLHHFVLAVQYRPPDPGHVFLRRLTLFWERIRQVAGVHLSQLLKVTERSSKIPVFAYRDRRKKKSITQTDTTACICFLCQSKWRILIEFKYLPQGNATWALLSNAKGTFHHLGKYLSLLLLHYSPYFCNLLCC